MSDNLRYHSWMWYGAALIFIMLMLYVYFYEHRRGMENSTEAYDLTEMTKEYAKRGKDVAGSYRMNGVQEMVKENLTEDLTRDLTHDENVWYWKDISTGVGYGDKGESCPSFEVYCSGDGQPPTYGSFDLQMAAIKQAISNGGMHPQSPLIG